MPLIIPAGSARKLIAKGIETTKEDHLPNPNFMTLSFVLQFTHLSGKTWQTHHAFQNGNA
jgi:hypothetical protein